MIEPIADPMPRRTRALPQIHPTAIVEDSVEMADDVFIGPHCCVYGPAKLGPGTRLIANVIVNGPISLGQNNIVYPFSTLGYAPQDRSYDRTVPGVGVVIGNDNIFRESATVNRATKDKPTTIGDCNFFMACCHVAHDAVVGNNGNFANSSLLAGHCQIGDQVILAGTSGVAQFCRVGRLAMIGGASGVTRDVPPFCMVYHTRRINSLNLVGLRRSGLRDSVRPLMIAFDIVFRQSHTNQAALEIIRDDEIYENAEVKEFADFIADSKKGITQYGDEFASSV